MNDVQQSKVAGHRAHRHCHSGGCATYTGQTNDPNDPNRTRNNA